MQRCKKPRGLVFITALFCLLAINILFASPLFAGDLIDNLLSDYETLQKKMADCEARLTKYIKEEQASRKKVSDLEDEIRFLSKILEELEIKKRELFSKYTLSDSLRKQKGSECTDLGKACDIENECIAVRLGKECGSGACDKVIKCNSELTKLDQKRDSDSLRKQKENECADLSKACGIENECIDFRLGKECGSGACDKVIKCNSELTKLDQKRDEDDRSLTGAIVETTHIRLKIQANAIAVFTLSNLKSNIQETATECKELKALADLAKPKDPYDPRKDPNCPNTAGGGTGRSADLTKVNEHGNEFRNQQPEGKQPPSKGGPSTPLTPTGGTSSLSGPGSAPSSGGPDGSESGYQYPTIPQGQLTNIWVYCDPKRIKRGSSATCKAYGGIRLGNAYPPEISSEVTWSNTGPYNSLGSQTVTASKGWIKGSDTVWVEDTAGTQPPSGGGSAGSSTSPSSGGGQCYSNLDCPNGAVCIKTNNTMYGTCSGGSGGNTTSSGQNSGGNAPSTPPATTTQPPSGGTCTDTTKAGTPERKACCARKYADSNGRYFCERMQKMIP